MFFSNTELMKLPFIEVRDEHELQLHSDNAQI
jgi:hypothetical protein